MRYENRQPAEGINVTQEHPLRVFVRLLIAGALLVALLVVVLQFSGAWLAKRIPFAAEQRTVNSLGIEFGDPKAAPELQVYLNELAGRLSRHMPLPEGMRTTLHYNPDKVFNAYATLGGNLLFYRGLLERMPSENALAMVVAHEIADVMHRDPVAGLGGGIASLAALLMVTGNAGTAGNFISTTGGISALQFTRRMENEADRAAVEALAGLYGHLGGAGTLFRLIQKKRKDGTAPRWLQRFLSTHPLDADRIVRIATLAGDAGVPATGEATPLPDSFKRWLAQSAD